MHTEQPDGSPPADDLDRQLKELERDKRLEEIRQLRASATARWATPTALAALLPLLAGFGLWIMGELKQFNEGYRALAERDALRREKQDLQDQKDSLHLEVSTLLLLKNDHAAEAERLRRDAEQQQTSIDHTYLSAAFTSAELAYALAHVEGLGPAPDEANLAGIREELGALSPEIAAQVEGLIERHRLTTELVSISREMTAELAAALELIPASDWTRKLRGMPTGAILPNRKIMMTQDAAPPRYYDVELARWLTAEETQKTR